MSGKRHPAMDWQKFQRDLMKQMPFVGKDLDTANIASFVKKAIDEFMPKSMPRVREILPFAPKSLDYDLFETHRSIFVRCKLPGEAAVRDIRFFANRRKLKIEYGDQTEEIALPDEVNTGRAVARLHDGVLEIRMPKSNPHDPFREIFIRES